MGWTTEYGYSYLEDHPTASNPGDRVCLPYPGRNLCTTPTSTKKPRPVLQPSLSRFCRWGRQFPLSTRGFVAGPSACGFSWSRWLVLFLFSPFANMQKWIGTNDVGLLFFPGGEKLFDRGLESFTDPSDFRLRDNSANQLRTQVISFHRRNLRGKQRHKVYIRIMCSFHKE